MTIKMKRIYFSFAYFNDIRMRRKINCVLVYISRLVRFL